MRINQFSKSNFIKHRGFSVWIGRRFWESRQFYSAYIALFIAISNWITIQYKLLLENVPFFNYLFSNMRDLMIPVIILQLETLEAILTANNLLTDEKKNQFEKFRKDLTSLSEGKTFDKMRNVVFSLKT